MDQAARSNQVKKSSYDNHLTADMATCQKCGVTQRKTELQQQVTLRKLKERPADPSLPVDVHSEAELLEQQQAPWNCVDGERCVKHRIEAAVQADRQRVWSAVNQVMQAPHSALREWVDPPPDLTPSAPSEKEYERRIKQLGKDLPADSKVRPRLKADRAAAQRAGLKRAKQVAKELKQALREVKRNRP